MEKTPTAEEFLNHQEKTVTHFEFDIRDVMIKFAKLHVEAALKSASEATLLYNFKEEIINSYPLENIE